jgi:anti-anti-sigma regulatory factor
MSVRARQEIGAVEVGPGTFEYVVIVSLQGEHDLATLEEVESVLAMISGTVLVDLSGCTFLDIAVAGALERKAIALARGSHRLDLVSPLKGSGAARTLELMGMLKFVAVQHGRSIRTSRGVAVTNLTITGQTVAP